MYTRTVQAILVAAIISTAAPASGATVTKKDGTVVQGDVVGIVLLADSDRPMFAVVEGKDIETIDERGVRLKAGAVVLHTGMPLGSDPAVYKSTGASAILKATMPVAAKKEAVKQVSEAFSLVLSGEGEGPGFGSVAVGKGRAFYMKRFSDAEKLPVAGELRETKGVYSVTPSVRVQTAAGVVSIDAGAIKVAPVDGK